MEIKNEEEQTEEEGESTLKPADEEEKTLSPNERAEANIAAMKAENDRMEANINSMQEMKATEMLSGSANAGQVPEAKAEQSDEDYAKAVMAGEKPEAPK